MERRLCGYRHCRKEKPITEFRLKKNGRRNAYCNECSDYFLKKSIESQSKHRDAVNEAQRKRYEDRKVEVLPPDMQRCRRCKEVKPKLIFEVSRFGRMYTQCPPCKEYGKEWVRKKRNSQTPAQTADSNHRRNEANRLLRRDCIEAYGGKCDCCGESHYEFLAVDHVNGGGHRHRQHLKKAGVNFAAWLKAQGFPKDEYRLLCHNCNVATGIYGYCPHKKQS